MGAEKDPLEARVLETVRARGLVQPGEMVLVAVSGGADSVALLLLLCALAQTLHIRVEAAHYEHGIRGEASIADARFVQALCAVRGIPCHVGNGDVPAMAREWRVSLEGAARRARYTFLDETAARIGADTIALAHQLEDQAETLLLHLTHGCGLQGLGAMRMRQGNRIRPLLEIPRATLEEYLLAREVAWREDATNLDTAHARNLLRREVFPLLRQLNPRVAEAMSRTAALAAETADTLDAQARKQLSGRVKRLPYGAFWLVDEMTAEAVRAFAGWTGVPPLDARQTQEIMRLCPGGSANLPQDWRALQSAERLHLIRPAWDAKPVNADDFIWTQPTDGTLGDGIRRQVFDADALEGAAFRRRQAGDVFAPLGGGGTQKLKQTLRDAGVDRPFRDLLPVLAKGKRVLWVVGLKPGADAAVRVGTRRRTQIEYHGDLPWEIKPTTMEE